MQGKTQPRSSDGSPLTSGPSICSKEFPQSRALIRFVDVSAPRQAASEVEEVLRLVLDIVAEVYKSSEEARLQELTEERVLMLLDIVELVGVNGNVWGSEDLLSRALQVCVCFAEPMGV